MTQGTTEQGADALQPPRASEDLYLDLLKRCLTRSAFGERYQPIDPLRRSWKRALYVAHLPLRLLLALGGMELVRRTPFDAARRAQGLDIPPDAETMVGTARLDNLHELVAEVVRRGVPGDLAETGVWRGGTAIFMRAALEAYGDTDRTVWAADSFRGVPKPDVESYPADEGDPFWRNAHLGVPLEDVQENFRRYGLLDDRVRFLEGWFRDTLPSAPIERLALLRLDGDLYESTSVALEALYPKISVGGYVVVDDYGGGAPGCAQAVDEYRSAHDITEELVRIDWNGAYWQRTT
jgi:O-methyltransferase